MDGRGRRLGEEQHLLADPRARWPAPPRGMLAVRRRHGVQRDIVSTLGVKCGACIQLVLDRHACFEVLALQPTFSEIQDQ